MTTAAAYPPAREASTARPKVRAAGSRTRTLRGWAAPARIVSSLVIILAGWAIIAPQFPSFIFPAPVDVWTYFLATAQRGVWGTEVLGTLGHMGLAFAIVVVVGIPLGIFIGRSRIAEDFARIPIILLQTLPPLITIIVALIIFGVSEVGVIVVTVAGSITTFLFNVIQGTRAVDPDLVQMARSYRTREPAIMRSILVPSIVPYVLAAGRVTIGSCLGFTLFAEYMMGVSGVGYQLAQAMRLLDTVAIYMWGLSMVIIAIIIEYAIFRPVENALTRHLRKPS